MTHRCSKCGATKDAAEFHKARRRKHGLQGWCKACQSSIERRTEVVTPPTIVCPKCGTEKSSDDFHLCRVRKTGRKLWCKTCNNANAIKSKRLAHERDVARASAQADGRCEICQTPSKRLKLDHARPLRAKRRKGDTVRAFGMLCSDCLLAAHLLRRYASLREWYEHLDAAQTYIERPAPPRV